MKLSKKIWNLDKLSLIVKLSAPLILGCFLSCNQNYTNSVETTDSQMFSIQKAIWNDIIPDGVSTIKVINQNGQAIANAKILIGLEMNIPFQGNFFTTNSTGKVQIPKEWNKSTHVTVDATGYIRQTLLNLKPGNLTIKLNNAYLEQPAELNGKVTNLPVINGDKLVDFGLVMPTIKKADFLNFDLDQVLSPYTDILSVMGQKAPLPSNVSLPSQVENYIFNITLNKPVYRLMMPTAGAKQFYAARGRFLFKPVVDELNKGKPFYDLLNYFNILGGGVRNINITEQITSLDIPGNELEFKNSVTVKAADVQADEVLLVLTASESQGSLIPTDVKKATSNQDIALNAFTAEPNYVLSVIKKQDEFMSRKPGADRMTTSFLPFKKGEKQILLPLVQNPTISFVNNIFYIQQPKIVNPVTINPIALSAIISDLIETQDGDKILLSTKRRWEVLGLNWNEKLELPHWPLENMTKNKRLEINYIGSTTTSNVNLDDSIIKAATHVSHASTDF